MLQEQNMPKKSKAVISLGSNVAPKAPTLHKAIGEIVHREIGQILLVSPFYKTTPWGVEDQDWFVNGCLMLETELSAYELLTALQKIENDYGRVRDVKWGPRTLDLDILMFEGIDKQDDVKLTLPHPEMLNRSFVLRPMIDLFPWMQFDGKSLHQYLEKVKDQGVIRLALKEDSFEAILNMYFNLSPRKITPGLDRVTQAMQNLLGTNFESQLPKVIHIAGTNGKGSVAAMTHKLLNKVGKTVHRYTSPHLCSYAERFMIGINHTENRFVTITEFEIAVSRVAPLVETLELSHFEALTVVAFLLFAGAPADYLILETGMGGRLDATNIINHPVMTAITSVSLDHTEFLGDMIEMIAHEKAGIIKKNVPVIVGARDLEAQRVIAEIAEANHAPISMIEKDWDIHLIDNAEVLLDTNADNEDALYLDALALEGGFQFDNASVSINIVKKLLGKHALSDEIIDDSLASVKWFARLEAFDPTNAKVEFPEDVDMIIDGCHNHDGIEYFTDYMLDLDEEDPKPLTLFLSCKKGRDLKDVFSILKNLPATFVFIQHSTATDQYTAEEMATEAANFGLNYKIEESWVEPLRHIILDDDAGSKRYAVCGSLYFCGAFFKVVKYDLRPK